MDNVKCQYCQRQCVPKLWHYRPMLGSLRYMRTQHICPFCGGVMHQSGGQLTFIGWLIAITVGAIFTVGFIADLLKSKNVAGAVSGIGSLIIFGYVIFKLYKRTKK